MATNQISVDPVAVAAPLCRLGHESRLHRWLNAFRGKLQALGLSPRWVRWVMLFVGWGLILLGLTGFVVPILPGVPFLLAALVVLSCEYVWAERLLGKVTKRFPWLHGQKAAE